MQGKLVTQLNKRLLTVSLLMLLGFAAAACGSDSDSSASGDADSGGDSGSVDIEPIDIWVDAARVPAVEAFQAKYPDIPLAVNNITNTGGGSGLKQQFALFNQAGEGWPDVIFFGGIDDIAWAAGDDIDYAADLSGLLTDEFIAGYSDSAIAPCVVNGTFRCLRNDQAQDVLWYNKAFFDENGYDVPTTWAEYEALSLTIADEHPGKFTGILGDALATARYLWASGCPTNELIGDNTVNINLDDPKCTRVRDMLDHLLAAGVVASGGTFDSDVAADVGPNLVMTPGATWYGNFLFRDSFGVPAGEMSAALPMSWEGEEKFTGNEGGGLWVVSRHMDESKSDAMVKIMEFMNADPSWQVELSTGLPAYGSLQQPWLDKQIADGYFTDTDTLSSVFIEAGTLVRPYSLLEYNTGDIWAQTITPKMISEGSVSAGWDDFARQLEQEAATFGYEVVKQ